MANWLFNDAMLVKKSIIRMTLSMPLTVIHHCSSATDHAQKL